MRFNMYTSGFDGNPFPGSVLFDYSYQSKEWGEGVNKAIEDSGLNPDGLVRAICKGTDGCERTSVHFADKETFRPAGRLVKNREGEVLENNLYQPEPHLIDKIVHLFMKTRAS